jgi:hypothetical protein
VVDKTYTSNSSSYIVIAPRSDTRQSAPENLRIPERRFLPEGYACAATDRCFLLANCCSPLAKEPGVAASDLPEERKEEKERNDQTERASKEKFHYPTPRDSSCSLFSSDRLSKGCSWGRTVPPLSLSLSLSLSLAQKLARKQFSCRLARSSFR